MPFVFTQCERQLEVHQPTPQFHWTVRLALFSNNEEFVKIQKGHPVVLVVMLVHATTV